MRFAREGASVAISDIGQDIATVPFGLSADQDLAETARLCEAEGARVLADRVDVRDLAQVQAFADRTLTEFGKIDALVANAGIFSFGRLSSRGGPSSPDARRQRQGRLARHPGGRPEHGRSVVTAGASSSARAPR